MTVTKLVKIHGTFSLFITLIAWILPATLSHAHSAVAWAEDHPVRTIYAVWNFPTQKKADAGALEGCRKSAKKNGLSKVAATCRVRQRQKAAGGGAIVCGKTGCSSSTGFETKQAAVDEAYRQCQKQEYGDCQETNILGWWDEEGYARVSSRQASTTKTCGPPPGRTVRSTYQCSNGDCIRTFENGCSVRFQAPYCHDPFSGKWEWKPNGC